jgi:hypothetical protein
MKKLKLKIKQLFCHHEYVRQVAIYPGKMPFFILSGQTIYIRCPKCGKIKEEFFERNWDGS